MKKRSEIITLPTGKQVIVEPTFNADFGAWEYNRREAFIKQAPTWYSWFLFRLGLQDKMFKSTLGKHTGVEELNK